MNRNIIIGLSAVAIIAIAYWYFSDSQKNTEGLYTTVKRGDFPIPVSSTGELEAKNFVRIKSPSGLRRVGIHSVKIAELIPEGTKVDSGDFVARLELSTITDKISTALSDLTKVESKFTQSKLDTALDLRQARDNLKDLKFAIEEKRIVVEQSAFEPPATQKQARIELEKAIRNHSQTSANYELKRQQAVAKMREAWESFQQEKRKVDYLDKLRDQFTIKAPEPGMLTYYKGWEGKRRTGTEFRTWDPTVATLPDLSVMNSRTYINEVDIRKVKKGQGVEIGFDAYPDKKLTGEVSEVAQMSEKKPNSEVKVYEVVIEIHEQDTTLRPGMTTSNMIMTDMVLDVLFVPLEAVQTEGDSLTYVFVKDGLNIYRQSVSLGKTNENEVVIKEGLQEGQTVYLTIPENADKIQQK